MKRLFIILLAMLALGGALQAQNKPRYIYIAGQNGDKVEYGNCFTKNIATVNGYLHNICLDNSGNVYVLVCDQPSGWGNYYIYKNSNTQEPYMSFVWNAAEGIYSSMVMRVKDNHVVVAGVQSLGFNNKGYQSRMFGYVDKVLVFRSGYDRKSLKYDNFVGYQKFSGKKLIGYGEENNSGNPQGDHLSCVYHVDGVDYYDGDIYISGWGEREYSETVGGTKYYLVHRCPRVWKNGTQIIEQYNNKTGAAWSVNVMKGIIGVPEVLTSGHKGSVSYSWYDDKEVLCGTDNYMATKAAGYPGFIKEEFFNTSIHSHCRVYLSKGIDGISRMEGRFMTTRTAESAFSAQAEDFSISGSSVYYLGKTPADLKVFRFCGLQQRQDNNTYEFTKQELVVAVPDRFHNYNNLKIAVAE